MITILNKKINTNGLNIKIKKKSEMKNESHTKIKEMNFSHQYTSKFRINNNQQLDEKEILEKMVVDRVDLIEIGTLKLTDPECESRQFSLVEIPIFNEIDNNLILISLL